MRGDDEVVVAEVEVVPPVRGTTEDELEHEEFEIRNWHIGIPVGHLLS